MFTCSTTLPVIFIFTAENSLASLAPSPSVNVNTSLASNSTQSVQTRDSTLAQASDSTLVQGGDSTLVQGYESTNAKVLDNTVQTSIGGSPQAGNTATAHLALESTQSFIIEVHSSVFNNSAHAVNSTAGQGGGNTESVITPSMRGSNHTASTVPPTEPATGKSLRCNVSVEV